MNSLKVNHKGRTLSLFGGPFRNKPKSAFGVCLLERKAPGTDYHLPILDFTTPTQDEARDVVDLIVAKMIAHKQPVYVGCALGQGRTGTILAMVASVFGEKTPVEYVRAVYNPAAVETKAQYEAVMAFTPKFRTKIRLWFGF